MIGSSLFVIGASAAGLDALTRLVAQLPADFPAPIFVVNHMAADANSEVVARSISGGGPLPCTLAQDGHAFEGGHIYIAPADHHLLAPQPADDGQWPPEPRLLQSRGRAGQGIGSPHRTHPRDAHLKLGSDARGGGGLNGLFRASDHMRRPSGCNAMSRCATSRLRFSGGTKKGATRVAPCVLPQRESGCRRDVQLALL